MTDIIGLVGDMFGGNPLMVSKKVKDFIEKNTPKAIVVDMETVSKIDNVEVYTNSTKQKIEIVVKKARTNQVKFLQPNEGLVVLDKGEHLEYYKQHLPLKLFFYPSEIDINVEVCSIVFKPWMNSYRLEKPESEAQQWIWRASKRKITTEQRLSSVIAEAMGVGAKTILFPERIVKLPHSNNPWLSAFNSREELLPVFYFRREAVEEAISMINKLERFLDR